MWMNALKMDKSPMVVVAAVGAKARERRIIYRQCIIFSRMSMNMSLCPCESVCVCVCALEQFDYLKCENDLKLGINEFVTFLNCLQFFIWYMLADGEFTYAVHCIYITLNECNFEFDDSGAFCMASSQMIWI